MWQLVFVLGCIADFALSVEPVTWIVLTEIFPMSVGSRALALATMALWFFNFSLSQAFPMLDQSRLLQAKFHNGFPFFFMRSFASLKHCSYGDRFLKPRAAHLRKLGQAGLVAREGLREETIRIMVRRDFIKSGALIVASGFLHTP
ncbi:MAG: MFS transporter [Silvibacterium sp.]